MNDVEWIDAALDQLADIYVATAAGDREGIVSAVEEIDRVLGQNGQIEGESRGGYHRIYFHDLLVVFFAIVPHAPIQVTGVRSNRRKNR